MKSDTSITGLLKYLKSKESTYREKQNRARERADKFPEYGPENIHFEAICKEKADKWMHWVSELECLVQKDLRM